MVFWIVTGALALVIGAILAAAVLRGRVGDMPPAAYDLEVYREQLREVEKDLARGTLSEDEATRLRTEVSRRILAADTALQAAQAGSDQPRAAGVAMAAVLVVVAVGGSFALYSTLGAPGYGDLPRAARLAMSDDQRANRLTQDQAESRAGPLPPAPPVPDDFAKLMESLRAALNERPDDLRGLSLLAQNEAMVGNPRAALAAQQHLVTLKGDDATAEDHAFLADLMVISAGGYVSIEAEQALRRALELDPKQPEARYYLGLYFAQVDRADAAFRVWRALLDDSTADDAWTLPLRAQIEEAAARAGIRFVLPELQEAPDSLTPPNVAKGPTADDVLAAQDMTPDERREMIGGMVNGLLERLGTEGGPPEDWARLIASLGVLGETDRAVTIYDEAQGVFSDDPDALAQLLRAARAAGLAQ
ncbi:c-type cytochrome biogenesis protein CcmI [Rhodobacteraceae bacterium KMM 6894]|nr:c-type cytochrome biogenesis protein CcmI [Rhodobacteraceae bacterium KMM 6894]